MAFSGYEFTFIVDFTWDPARQSESLKILEMGDLYKSEITGLDQLQQKRDQKLPTVKEAELTRLTKKYPGAVYIEDTSSSFSRSVNIHDFVEKTKTMFNYTKRRHPGADLSKFMVSRGRIAKSGLPMRDFLVSLAGIKIPYEEQVQLDATAKNRTHFVLVNYVSAGLFNACIDKVAFYTFCKNDKVVPATHLVNLQDRTQQSQIEIENFLQVNDAEYFVIKPTNRSCGLGVRVIEKHKLMNFIEETMKEITLADKNFSNYANGFLLIQSLCPSKEVNIAGELYHPTGRLVMRATLSEPHKLPSLEILGGYWKLPRHTSHTGFSTSSIVSNVGENYLLRVAEISPTDLSAITIAFQKQFSPILQKMFNMTASDMKKEMEADKTMLACYSKAELFGTYEASSQITEINQEKETELYLLAGYQYFSNLSYGSPEFDRVDSLFHAAIGLIPYYAAKITSTYNMGSVGMGSLIDRLAFELEEQRLNIDSSEEAKAESAKRIREFPLKTSTATLSYEESRSSSLKFFLKHRTTSIKDSLNESKSVGANVRDTARSRMSSCVII